MRRDQKQALDQETPYLTLLPPMDEGFHTGYHTQPGIVSDHNQRPREWLESLARYMRTPGNDVSYSIPSVLSGEQQLRRLARIASPRALAHPRLLEYRAVLALLLLWDTWPRDDSWPSLELISLGGETAFSASVLAALPARRAEDGLWVFTLRAPGAAAQPQPIALLSRDMAVVPAANPGDLSALLPPCVTWYDRARQCYLEPCPLLCERDAAILSARLRMLQALNEQPGLRSPLYSPDAELCAVLSAFVDELALARKPWRDKLERADESALRSLRLRLLGAYAPGLSAIASGTQTVSAGAFAPGENPLLRVFLRESVPEIRGGSTLLYTLEGEPFACASDAYGVEPARTPNEPQTLDRLEKELSLLERNEPAWRLQAAQALRGLVREVKDRPGLWPQLPRLLSAWARELESQPAPASRVLTLSYPLEAQPAALQHILASMFGSMDAAAASQPFADCLLLAQGQPPFDSAALNEHCRVEHNGAACYAIPPLSPQLCAWLTARAEEAPETAPVLETDSLSFSSVSDGKAILASFRLSCRLPGDEACRVSAVTFQRVYTLSGQAQSGAAILLPEASLPQITLWPRAHFAPGLWKQYFIHAHVPGSLEVWGLSSGGWRQGTPFNRETGAWQTVCTDRFPSFVALRQGGLSLGAVPCCIPLHHIKHEPAAVAAIDFGSISTTVMLRQGERIQPAVLPECMHARLLGRTPDADVLREELLPQDVLLPNAPVEATYYSVMDMFRDQPEAWNAVLTDGHIYYHGSLGQLIEKAAGTLYYDLKWGGEPYSLRCLRLFLKQVMTQASLSARLWGSPSVSWRVSMPNAMPPHKQEAYLELMRGLAREVAAETGLPLSPDGPAVLYATENQADGLYFLSRSEANAHSGYLNLDIGGSTTDLSLWLLNATHATIECSLRLGCRQMLFDSLGENHLADLETDFSQGSAALAGAVQQTAAALRRESATARGRLKCMFLMDDLFAAYAQDIREAMAVSRATGRIGYVESLLLFEIGFLYYLSGEVLHRAWQDEELRPLLPERMALCIAGNGGQLVKIFTDEQQTRLCSLALSRLEDGHPLRVVLPIQSRHPKQEVARGLLCPDAPLSSAIQGLERWNGTRAFGESERENLLLGYLPLFYRVFPQAANRLMPNAFEGANGDALTATAAMELDTIFENEKPRTPEDDMAMYVRCFMHLKRLWRL